MSGGGDCTSCLAGTGAGGAAGCVGGAEAAVVVTAATAFVAGWVLLLLATSAASTRGMPVATLATDGSCAPSPLDLVCPTWWCCCCCCTCCTTARPSTTREGPASPPPACAPVRQVCEAISRIVRTATTHRMDRKSPRVGSSEPVTRPRGSRRSIRIWGCTHAARLPTTGPRACAGRSVFHPRLRKQEVLTAPWRRVWGGGEEGRGGGEGRRGRRRNGGRRRGAGVSVR